MAPRRRTRTRRSATASPRPARTIAAPPRTPAPARRRRTTRPTSGSTFPRAHARRPAERPSRPRASSGAAMDEGRGAERVGIGLRAPHYAELLARRPALAFLEVHSENYFGDGGAALAWLERLRECYPVSLH